MIAFIRDTTSSTTDDTSDIWVMQANGTGLVRLTNTAAAEYAPSWSPDGSRIAFSSNRAGNYEIYSMKIDGSDVRRLTYHTAIDDMPSWSPDGTRLAFASNRSGSADIWVMNANGSSPTRLTTDANLDMEPTWSPDAAKIAFTTDRTGDYEIFTMAANGSAQTNLTNDPVSWDFAASWSPDGSYVTYYGDPYGDLDVQIIPAAGGSPGLVTTSFDDDFNPDWQPIPDFPLVDARFSAFESDIEWVFNEGITSGCSAERYCPADSVTREQMASFLARALSLPSATKDWFTDDETSIHEVDINRVAEAGIATGCGGTNYCPKAVVTRAQMASFLARGLALPSTTTDFFTDDGSSVHEVDINRVAAAGITSGCTATTYCPLSPVTRGQMAAFLHRALT